MLRDSAPRRLRPARAWQALAALLMQLLVLAAMPREQLLARRRGIDVTLRTAPIDPYSAASGYYLALRYAVENEARLQLQRSDIAAAREIWVTLRRATPAWELVSVSSVHPAPEVDRVSIRAHAMYGAVRLEGLSRIYVPEAERTLSDSLFRVASRVGARRDGADTTDAPLVDLRVDPATGAVAPLRLRIGRAAFGAR